MAPGLLGWLVLIIIMQTPRCLPVVFVGLLYVVPFSHTDGFVAQVLGMLGLLEVWVFLVYIAGARFLFSDFEMVSESL